MGVVVSRLKAAGLSLGMGLGLATGPATACEIALVLAIDVSGSVNPDEYQLQMDGLAAALNDGAVSEALVRSQASVMVMQWTGQSRQDITVPWRKIKTFEDVDNLGLDVMTATRAWRSFSTAIGEALQVALDSFDEVPECLARTIDVSGDGVSNEGVAPQEIWPALRAAEVTVNALAIESDFAGLTQYFRGNVITGPGSFAMTAKNHEDYPRAIRQKLLREITKQTASLPIIDE